jgi:hemerythrin
MSMYNIEWNDSIVLGVPSIDEDHKKLVEMLNELFVACFASQGPTVLGGIVDRLVDYTKYHFKREERLLKEAGYEWLDGHVAEHEKMIGEVEEIQKELQGGSSHQLSNDTLKFLHHWLTDHIKSEDMEFGPLLRARHLG